MPFYCGKRSGGICVVLGPKKSSTYSSEYASGFFEPAASLLPTAPLPRNEGLLGQTPSLIFMIDLADFNESISWTRMRTTGRRQIPNPLVDAREPGSQEQARGQLALADLCMVQC